MRFLNEERFFANLSEEKIEAIKTTVYEVMKMMTDEKGGEMPRRGTFILDGQAFGGEAQCIYRFNLISGEAMMRVDDIELSSNTLAGSAINGILAWPKSKVYAYEADPKYFGKMPSGIYRGTERAKEREKRLLNEGMPSGIYHGTTLRNLVDDAEKAGLTEYGFELKTMVLNTNHGRFVAAFYADSEYGHELSTAVLAAVAQMLYVMGAARDFTLKKAFENVHAMVGDSVREILAQTLEKFWSSELDEAQRIKRVSQMPPIDRNLVQCYFE